ncbi:hypothetical protein TeGR_g295, partial [Tetraparma gracilis]
PSSPSGSVHLSPLTLRSTPASLLSSLASLLASSSLPPAPITLIARAEGGYAAVVHVPDVKHAIRCLDNLQFDGARLRCTRAQPKPEPGAAGAAKGGRPAFGGGWAGPGGGKKKRGGGGKKPAAAPPAKPKEEAKPKESASPASCGVARAPGSEEAAPPPPAAEEDSLEAFRRRMGGGLGELMEGYGEFEALDPGEATGPPPPPGEGEGEEESDLLESEPEEEETPRSMLAPNGKAPVHLELASFGFTYGKPSSRGWSSGDPLPAYDVRALPAAPDSVARLSGLSYRVKRELLRNRGSKEGESTPLWDAVHQVARDAVKALEDAVEAGAGWAAPLTVTVNVGSEAGRHRSVAVCEAAAVAVRNLLRRNGGGIEVPCSVGTRHRDVDRKRGKEKKGNDD